MQFRLKYPNTKHLDLPYYQEEYARFNKCIHMHMYPSQCWRQVLAQNMSSRASAEIQGPHRQRARHGQHAGWTGDHATH